MSLAWFFLALTPVGVIVYVVWAYRKKTAARAAASSERFAQIFNPSTQRSAAPDMANTGSPGAVPSTEAAARGTAVYARRARLLSPQHIQLLELLGAGLPDHEVFAHVSLAATIEFTGLPGGREREQRSRALAQHTVDCVVCSKAFEVIAVVDLESGHTAETRFRAECLKAAGVRYLRWNPLELPRSDEVAALIGGK